MNLKLTGKTDLLLSETNAIVMEFNTGSAPAETKEVETIVGILLLGNRATVQETSRTIEDYFDSAKRAQKDLTLPKIYLEADTGDGYVRSEILDGVLDTETEYFDRVARNHVPARIWVKRKNYWEGGEVQIPLTNENGTDNTTGLTVYNTNDGTGTAPSKRVNYVGIDGDDVDGSIPTQPRIEIQSTYADSRLYDIWVGRSLDDTTYPFQWFISHEATKDYSADNETQVSLTELSSTFLNGAKGGHYRVFTKVHYGYQDLRMNVGLYYPSTVALTPMQKAPEIVHNNKHVVELGTLQLPPWLPGLTGFSPVGLRLGARRVGGFKQTFYDYFLFPANAFRQLTPRGYGLSNGVMLADDGITETTWTSGKTGIYSGYGDWITLVPGKDQKLLFLTKTWTGGYEDDITMKIKVYYRPRRLTP